MLMQQLYHHIFYVYSSQVLLNIYLQMLILVPDMMQVMFFLKNNNLQYDVHLWIPAIYYLTVRIPNLWGIFTEHRICIFISKIDNVHT
eukprot:UN06161